MMRINHPCVPALRETCESVAAVVAQAAPSPVTMVRHIQAVVALHFGVTPGSIRSHDRHKTVSLARHIAMYFAHHQTALSYPEIGFQFGDRDHTTVLSAVRKIESALRCCGGGTAPIHAHIREIAALLAMAPASGLLIPIADSEVVP